MSLSAILKRAMRDVKKAAEGELYGITSDDFQTLKRAKHAEVVNLLSRFQSEEGAKILISTELHEYKSRSALEYATSLLSNEVKDMLTRDHKALDITTTPNTNYRTSEVISTFVLLYDHCKTHNKHLLDAVFPDQCRNMLQYKMDREWSEDQSPGLDVINRFIHSLATGYSMAHHSIHFSIPEYCITQTEDSHYKIFIGDGPATFNIEHDGSIKL